MLDRIKQLVRHTAVYSIGNIATKGIGLVTLPLYTKFISLEQFGLLGIIEITMLILVEVLTLGQANSILIFNNAKEFKDKKKSSFYTITLSVFIFNFFFLSLAELFKAPIFEFLNISSLFYSYFSLGILIIFLRIINLLFLYKLRAEEKSFFYTIITIVKIISILILVIFFVAIKKIGIDGVLYSYLISEILILLITLPWMIGNMLPIYDKLILVNALKFGLPLIFGTIGIMLLNLSDRYMLQLFTNLNIVGLYDLGYRVAGVLNMFIIMPFNLTFLPSAYKIYKQHDDKRYYSKLMTYLCFVLVWFGLGLSLISKEIVKVFALNIDYWPAYTIVPFIVLAYVFSAARNVASLGMFLTKNTKYVALTTMFSALINVLLNYWLIPIYGMMAAAYSTLFAFLIYLILTKIFSDKFYKIKYENIKLIKIFLTGIFLYLISLLMNNGNILFLIIKIILFILFPFILYLFKVYEPIELKKFEEILMFLKKPSNLKYLSINKIYKRSDNEK